jgi:hypothetical protein
MRPRRFFLLMLALVVVAVVLRRRRSTEWVDVQFEDGSSIRLTSGPEARGLLDDAYTILELA